MEKKTENSEKMKKGKNRAAIAVLFAVAAVFLVRMAVRGNGVFSVLNHTAEGTKGVVVLDAGHGGFDPGKIGTAGTKEKDINLSIAKKTEKILTESGYTVVMTRESDTALDSGSGGSKKMADLNGRVLRIEEISPDVAVSIHQNSYSAQTRGTQVFYYDGDNRKETGKRLAEIMQDAVRDVLNDGNTREEKGNHSYYMLKKVTCPFVIVECGFLSNPEEEALLCEESYQEKMAEGICEGIENFLYK